MKRCTAPYNLILKPIGSVCNLRCEYCYYLEKYQIVMGADEKSQVMSDELLERMTREYIESQPISAQEVVFSWQGGEPTLLGIPFFEKALQMQEKYRREDMKILNALQTNGTLITPEFARFFRDNNFLIGISIDGPEDLHNRYRKNAEGKGSFAAVMGGLENLKSQGAEFNALTVVQKDNGNHPEEIYDFLKEIGVVHMQFIPIVETEGNKIGGRSVTPAQWGNFLQRVFDRWLAGDIGQIYVQHFDLMLSHYMGYPPSLCVHSPTCGRALALEHNGNLYSCDHFVDPEHLLGNIADTPLTEMVDSEKQRTFGKMKQDGLPLKCQNCNFLHLCYGGCLRNRLPAPDRENSLNYLCEGYSHFYAHTKPYFEAMERALSNREFARDFVKYLDPKLFLHVGRNDPCPCGSGKKFKHCHGKI